jgi:DNA polymerase-3 subunit epsilon
MRKILIVDIETTGLVPSRDKIVEVGIVSLDVDKGEKKILFDHVMHERPIDRKEVEESWIVKNGYMTVEEIQHSKQFKDYSNDIQKIFFDETYLGCTAYNSRFDFGFLESRNIVIPRKLKCPMKLATDICKIPKNRGSFKWPKVEEAWIHFFGKDTGYVEKHRGADDAYHEADIVMSLIELGKYPELK